MQGDPLKSIEWLRQELFALCEASEEQHNPIGRADLETKHGAYARGRAYEAKSLRRAMGERFALVIRQIKADRSPSPTEGDGNG